MTNFPSLHKQHGVVLVISLIMLVLLTLIGVTSMQVTGLEEKMSGNTRSQNTAFQSAETALRESELWLATQAVPPETSDARVHVENALDPNSANASHWWNERNDSWWTGNAVQYTTGSLPGVTDANRPYSIIEFKYKKIDGSINKTGYKIPRERNFYRITAKGTDDSGQANVLVQSITARKL